MCQLAMDDLVSHVSDLQLVAIDKLFTILRIHMHIAVDILVKLVAHMTLDELVLHQFSDVFSQIFVLLDAFIDKVFDLL